LPNILVWDAIDGLFPHFLDVDDLLGIISAGRRTWVRVAPISSSPRKRRLFSTRPDLVRAEQLIGWISGNFLHEFAFVAAASDQIYVRLLLPSGDRRLLLGFGNVGEDLQRNVENIREAAERDERFAYALSLYRDALHEANKLFKIARLFTVLEALAWALKKGGVGARDAVRKMMMLTEGAIGEMSYQGRTIRYERIALAGKLRDALFHGARFTRDDLPADYRDSFDLFTDQPDALIRDLMNDCELEFARWGNNASVARSAAEAAKD
jgi:hypothetical protein